MPWTICSHPGQLGENTLSPYNSTLTPPSQGIRITGTCREWPLSMLTSEPLSGTFLGHLHSAHTKIEPGDSTSN